MRKLYLLICFTVYLKALSANVGDIKCREYAKAVNVMQDSPVLSRQATQSEVADCGIVSVPLIIGGVKAQEKEFPHMVVIGFGESPTSTLAWDCGGSLISENFVLTAAHCQLSREKGDAQKVKLGFIDMESDKDDIQEIGIAEKIPHPNYNSATKYNDIALFKLKMSVKFSPYVRPACLNIQNEIKGKFGIATGFGKLAYGAKNSSKDLMKVQLEIIPNNKCEGYFKEKMQKTLENGVKKEMICAGVLSGGKDTCQGDSGGPFQNVLDEPYCMYNIIGVTSFGKFCGYANSPAIYTRVSEYIQWIESVVWNA